jgi:hypothetical protein
MELNHLDSSTGYKSKFERFSNGEYIEISCNKVLVAEFEYCVDKGLFFGFDYTENIDSNENPCIADLEDGYRIGDVFKPTELLHMLDEIKEEIPALTVNGRTLLEERIDNGTI